MILDETMYETSDLGLASSLVASKYTITNINKSNSKRVVFCFDKSSDLMKTVDAYWSNDLLLPASVLVDSIKMLKSRIYGA